jgi:hypothetical protein
MDNNTVTLGHVFVLPDEETAQGSARWNSMEEKLGKEVHAIKWKASMPDVVAKVGQLLNVPLPDIWISSWKKVEELNAALEESEKAPDDVTELELGQHTVKTTLHPYISVRIGKMPEKQIRFEVVLSCNLKGFILTLRRGEIREIATGECVVEGTLEYEGLVLAERKLEPIQLPGRIRCREGERGAPQTK